jgi:spermidine synthase
VTLFALGLSGFAAMGYEVLFVRVIALSFGLSAYSFTVMLMSFITGISLGGAIVSRLRVERPLWFFGLIQLVVLASFLAVTPFISRLPYLVALLRIELQDTSLGFELYQVGKAALCLGVLLLPTTCLGMSFPLVAQIQARRTQEVGSRVGSTYAWNTTGNVVGTIATSLLLLPALGLLGAFHFNFGLNLIAGLAVLLVAGDAPVSRRLLASTAAAVLTIVYFVAGNGWLDPLILSRNHLRLRSGPDPSAGPQARALHPSTSFEAWKEGYLARNARETRLRIEEDSHATVLAYGVGQNTSLYVNTKPDAATFGDLSTQMLLGHVPLFLAPQARSILVIGHGSGITAGSALRHPVERMDIVEISRAVLKVDWMFAPSNYHVLDDQRVQVYLEDGQSFLRTVPTKYDVIISEPSNPWIAGMADLFTVEFFEAARDRLNPGGLVVIWFQRYEQTEPSTKLLLRTIGSVFPYFHLWRSTDYLDVIAVGSMDPIEPNFVEMEDRFDNPSVRNDLTRIGVSSLAGLLIHHAISENRVRALISHGPLNTTAHQRLEYIAPRAFFSGESSLLIPRSDPLFLSKGPEKGIFLDRYTAYRAAAGDPCSRGELSDMVRRHPGRLGALIQERAQRAPVRSRRPIRAARGRVPEPSTSGYYEAAYWASRFQGEGKGEKAIAFSRRAAVLQADFMPSLGAGARGNRR